MNDWSIHSFCLQSGLERLMSEPIWVISRFFPALIGGSLESLFVTAPHGNTTSISFFLLNAMAIACCMLFLFSVTRFKGSGVWHFDLMGMFFSFRKYPLGELLYLFGFCWDLVDLLLICCIVFQVRFWEQPISSVVLRLCFWDWILIVNYVLVDFISLDLKHLEVNWVRNWGKDAD